MVGADDLEQTRNDVDLDAQFEASAAEVHLLLRRCAAEGQDHPLDVICANSALQFVGAPQSRVLVASARKRVVVEEADDVKAPGDVIREFGADKPPNYTGANNERRLTQPVAAPQHKPRDAPRQDQEHEIEDPKRLRVSK